MRDEVKVNLELMGDDEHCFILSAVVCSFFGRDEGGGDWVRRLGVREGVGSQKQNCVRESRKYFSLPLVSSGRRPDAWICSLCQEGMWLPLICTPLVMSSLFLK